MRCLPVGGLSMSGIGVCRGSPSAQSGGSVSMFVCVREKKCNFSFHHSKQKEARATNKTT